MAAFAGTAPWPAVLAADAASALEVPATLDLATFINTDVLHPVDGLGSVLTDADGALPHPPLDAIPPPPPPPPPPPAPSSLDLSGGFGPISPAPTPPRTTQDRARHAPEACSPALRPVGPLAHQFAANPSQVLAGIDDTSAFAAHAPENSCCAHAKENGQLKKEKQILLDMVQSLWRDAAAYTQWVQATGIQLDPVTSPLPDMPLPPRPPAANPIRGANPMLPCRTTIPTPNDDLLFPPSSSPTSGSPRSPSCNPHLIFLGGATATASLSRLRSVEPMGVDSESDSNDDDDDSDASSPGMWRRRVHERPPPPCPRLNGGSSMSPCPLEAPARRGMRLDGPRLIVRIPRWKLLGRPPLPARTPSSASSVLSSTPPSSPVRASLLVGRATTAVPVIASVHASDLALTPPDPCSARDPTPSSAPDPMSTSTSSPALSPVSVSAAATSPPSSPARGTVSAAPAPAAAPTRTSSRTPSTAPSLSRAPSPALAPSITAISTPSPAPAPIPAPAAPTQSSDPPASASPTPAPAPAPTLTLRDLLLPHTTIPAGVIPLPLPTAPAPLQHLAPLPPRAPGAPVVRRVAHVQVVIATPPPPARLGGVRPATAPPVAGKKPVARAGPSSPPPLPLALRAPSASATPRGRRASSSAAGTWSGEAAPAGAKTTPRGRRSNAAVADVVSPPVTPKVRWTNSTAVEAVTPVTPPRARRTSTTSSTDFGPPATPRARRASNVPTLALSVSPTTPRTRRASGPPMSTPATALPVTPRTRRASKTAAAAAVERPRPPQLPPLDHAPESESEAEQNSEREPKEPVRLPGRFVEIRIPIRVWRKMPIVQPAEDEASDTVDDNDGDLQRSEDVDMNEEETAPELPARPARSRRRRPHPPPPRVRRGWRVRNCSDDEEDDVIDVEGGMDQGPALSPSLAADMLDSGHGASPAASVKLDLDVEESAPAPARPRKRKLELVTSEGLNMVAAKRPRDEAEVIGVV
ncbi:hypothetical protein GGF31_003333 [Allomyces arbusculus]|nr:hypothetical protein GGF31_003333 [Allomyces arbusculus]